MKVTAAQWWVLKRLARLDRIEAWDGGTSIVGDGERIWIRRVTLDHLLKKGLVCEAERDE